MPALLISPFAEDNVYLASMLVKLEQQLDFARSMADARAILLREKPDLVICETDFMGGSWRVVLQELSGSQKLIVISRLADEPLWSEVLNLGGYDVLAKPFIRDEVERVLALACGKARERPGGTVCKARRGAA